ncbi:hypothetical protein SUNI508_08809 [Seiridium unicorne]|uniref:Elongator complex protein 6 n=1 Tax=Seiridium unicorne TaxID=138068 RepID=A0ABR2USZ1_9PEZI
MASRVPPLLEPYLGLPPEASLIVLTSVLGASTNWLVQRYLCSLLGDASRKTPLTEDENIDASTGGETCVVLVSFMRDYAFWKEGAGRLGLDLEGLSKKHRFKFVDGLTGLFSMAAGVGVKSPVATQTQHVLGTATLDELERVVHGALQSCASRNVVLILDNLDLLRATAGNQISGEALREALHHIRENVTSTIMTLAADEPLVSTQATSLEKDHAAVTLSLAHEAEMVISLRLLDTGTARDVSGVLRITPGGDATGFVSEERELLYFVGGDGSVRVFERGQ